MKRVLVLTNEAARHPFRQTLPPPRFWSTPAWSPSDIIADAAPAKRERTDLAFFGISFASFFVIIYGMII